MRIEIVSVSRQANYGPHRGDWSVPSEGGGHERTGAKHSPLARCFPGIVPNPPVQPAVPTVHDWCRAVVEYLLQVVELNFNRRVRPRGISSRYFRLPPARLRTNGPADPTRASQAGARERACGACPLPPAAKPARRAESRQPLRWAFFTGVRTCQRTDHSFYCARLTVRTTSG